MALQDAAPRADDDKVQLPRIHPVVHRRPSDPEHFSDFIDAVKPLVHRVPPAVVCQLWRRIRQLTVPVNCSYWVSIESVRLCVLLCTAELAEGAMTGAQDHLDFDPWAESQPREARNWQSYAPSPTKRA